MTVAPIPVQGRQQGHAAPAAGARLIEQLCAVARSAGDEIMRVYGTDFTASEKDDRSPLTEADLRADRAIRAGLERLFPGIPVVSEESLPRSAPDPGRPFFLVDPLDGTKEFVARTGEFTVNIALVQQGEVVAGVVLAPASGELFHAARGTGAFRTRDGVTAPIRVRPYADGECVRIVGSRSHGGERLASWVASLAVPQEFKAAGSSLKFCRVAEGAAHLYPRLGRTCQWDTAAAQCVLEEAGGRVTDLQGAPLRYEPSPDWANPEFIASSGEQSLALCNALRRS